MPKAPLSVQIKDAYKDGVVFYKDLTSIRMLDLVDVRYANGESISEYQSIGNQQYRFLEFSFVSNSPSGYGFDLVDALQDFNTSSLSDIYINTGHLATLETSSTAVSGIYNTVIKCVYKDVYSNTFTDSNNNNKVIKTLAVTYFPLKIIVEEAPTSFPESLSPTISTSGTLAALSSVSGSPSATTSFTVSGTNMTQAVTVTAPTGFEVSAYPTFLFSNSITIPASGTLANTTVYLRLSGSAGLGTYGGNITLASQGATTKTVSTLPSTVSPSTEVIKNGDLQMDVGVNQNIRLSYNSVHQTIYTRVTGLPAGMRFTGSPDGFASSSISGAPLTAGAYTVTISLTYKTSETSGTLNASKQIVFTVNDSSEPLILLANQNLTLGTSVNLKLRASDASTILGWSATGLPTGLVCGTGTSAAITGTPTAAGTYNATITLSCRRFNSSENSTITKSVTFIVT
jgi:hypothetical protein